MSKISAKTHYDTLSQSKFRFLFILYLSVNQFPGSPRPANYGKVLAGDTDLLLQRQYTASCPAEGNHGVDLITKLNALPEVPLCLSEIPCLPLTADWLWKVVLFLDLQEPFFQAPSLVLKLVLVLTSQDLWNKNDTVQSQSP